MGRGVRMARGDGAPEERGPARGARRQPRLRREPPTTPGDPRREVPSTHRGGATAEGERPPAPPRPRQPRPDLSSFSLTLSLPLSLTHTHARAGSEPRFSLSLAASEPATAPASPAPHGKGDAGTRARDRDPIGLGDHGAAATRSRVNDPSAGSPTETLLRLLLPLDSQVRPSSQRSARAVGRPRRGRSEGLTKPSNR